MVLWSLFMIFQFAFVVKQTPNRSGEVVALWLYAMMGLGAIYILEPTVSQLFTNIWRKILNRKTKPVQSLKNSK
jgi:hypothetical protein